MMQDPRPNKTPKVIICHKCKKQNWQEYFNCYSCLIPLNPQKVSIKFAFGKPGRLLGEKSYRGVQDYANQNPQDLLQPEKFSRESKKIEVDQNYIDEWGDPYQKAEIGTGVDEDINSGNIILESPEDDTITNNN